MGLARLSALFHFLIALLQGVPTVRHTDFLHGIASQFLDVETVNHSLSLRKCDRNNLAH